MRKAGLWVAPLGIGVVVLLIVVVVAVLASRDGVDATSDPVPTPSSATATAATETPSAEPSPSADPGVDIAGPMKTAVKDGFPAFVPAEVPAGWTTTAASYAPGQGAKSPVWSLAFQLPDGTTVELTQSELSLRQAVTRYLGTNAAPSGRVDLRRWGTGYWFVYSLADGVGMGKQLPSTSVVISAPSEDAAVTLAKQLLAAEDYAMPEAG